MAFVFPLCVLGLAVALYSAWFAIAPSDRIICTDSALVYRGVLRTVTIAWQDITLVRLHYGGRSPFVFLLVRCDAPKRRHKLNLSGLSPPHHSLVQIVRERAPRAAIGTPTGYGVAEAVVQKLLNL